MKKGKKDRSAASSAPSGRKTEPPVMSFEEIFSDRMQAKQDQFDKESSKVSREQFVKGIGNLIRKRQGSAQAQPQSPQKQPDSLSKRIADLNASFTPEEIKALEAQGYFL